MSQQLTVQQEREQKVRRFKQNLADLNDRGELDILPSSVSFDSFRNAAIVAVTDNPAILDCQPASVFKALRRLAAAGLVPDGREAALVPFKGEAQAMPMVAGLIKTARNSGEIVSIWADVVYDNEDLHVWIEDGERKFKHEYDPLVRTGSIKGAYAVAKLKDGTIEFEPMGFDQIEKRRKASANQKGNTATGIWAQWYDEMAKKTVIRALTKRLPVSSDDMRRMMVEQDEMVPIKDVTPEPEAPAKTLSQQLMDGDAAPKDGEVLPPEGGEWEFEEGSVDPFSDHYKDGAEAFKAGQSEDNRPSELTFTEWNNWIGGFRFEKAQAEGQT